MVKQFKRLRVLVTVVHKPSVVELITFRSNAVHVINKHLITALSEDPRDFTDVASVSLLTLGFDTYNPVKNCS